MSFLFSLFGGIMARETGRSGYKIKLKKKIETLLPGCFIMHQDPADTHQGIPDWLILWNDRWAMLEVKASEASEHQPNQEYWINRYGELGFTSFIYPENEEEVLNALKSTLTSGRRPLNA